MSAPRFRSALLLALAALSACSRDQKPDQPPATPATPIAYEPLSNEDLLGLDRAQVSLTLPFGDRKVSRDPAPNAARALVHDVDVAKGPSFDRALFEFGNDTDFPGYRVAWNDSANATCGPSKAPSFGKTPTLVVRLEPATTRPPGKNTKPMADASRRPNLPNVGTARMLCDTLGSVVWALGVSDSTAVRLLELRDPPRLVVDVAHKGAQVEGSPAPAAPARSDSGAAAPR